MRKVKCVGVTPNSTIYTNLRDKWDSWFWDQRARKFKWAGNHKIYSGADINYVVGGHAFHHYGVKWEAMVFAVKLWKYKQYNRLPDDPAMDNIFFWLYKGYNEFHLREDW
jgi:hypothetical protein